MAAENTDSESKFTVRGNIVVQKKNILDLIDVGAEVADDIVDVFGRKVSLQLISKEIDPVTQDCLRSDVEPVSGWFLSKDGVTPTDIRYEIAFHLQNSFGVPGAFAVVNYHTYEFFLRFLELQFSDGKLVHFSCNSWVYSSSKYKTDRVFFSNEVYLPNQTPPGLTKLRELELRNLRGDGRGERHESDRVYDYDLYNDLGNPDKSRELWRLVLGGSIEHPYPRRCRTGRKPANSDPLSESLPPRRKDFYVPSDERPSRQKTSAILGETLKAAGHSLFPMLKSVLGTSFHSFEQVRRLYHEGMSVGQPVTTGDEYDDDVETGPYTLFNALTESRDGNNSWLKYPLPQIIATDEWAWSSDAEFARQTIAGVHPLKLACMKEFPPESKLDPAKFGGPASSLQIEDIEYQLEGFSVQTALHERKLFCLDYHDVFMPFLSKMNSQDGIQSYASRSIFFLTKQGCLKPVAIELSLPPMKSSSSSNSRSHRVFFPPISEEKEWLWELAKAHASANDSTYHQVVSHWTFTHAVLEPFILATHRQLSVIHPVHLLLQPHFKDTLGMNALARRSLTNAGGMIESSFSSGKYSFEISSAAYSTWEFDKQGLPADLISRGLAVPDEEAKYGLKLTIEDHPYAVDGLEIWSAIRSWVHDFLSIFYRTDSEVKSDSELQDWWKELRTIGHGDKKQESWLAGVDSKRSLESVVTTVIWIGSAQHAAVNYGQFAYEGFMPNHPSKTHRLIPEEGSEEHWMLLENPEKFFLSTIPTKAETAQLLATLEVLSSHPEEEEYLGERRSKHWTSNAGVLAAFDAFSRKLRVIEQRIELRNRDERLMNRRGPANVAYTLLCPKSGPGLTGRGIPNSITI